MLVSGLDSDSDSLGFRLLCWVRRLPVLRRLRPRRRPLPPLKLRKNCVATQLKEAGPVAPSMFDRFPLGVVLVGLPVGLLPSGF